jgi:hypothetical protein
MIEDEATRRLGEVLKHLHAFAAGFSGEEYVDEASALTADDLGHILDHSEKIRGIAKATQAL